MPHDIEKLIKERPEMFDFADIPDNLDVDPVYFEDLNQLLPDWMKVSVAMDKLAPQWAKDLAAKRKTQAK